MATIAQFIEDYDGLVSALRERADEVNLSRNEIDSQAGIATGLTGKLLGPSRVKTFGKATLGPVLGALGLKILLIEDPAQTARIRARATPRDASQVRGPAINPETGLATHWRYRAT